MLSDMTLVKAVDGEEDTTQLCYGHHKVELYIMVIYKYIFGLTREIVNRFVSMIIWELLL